MSPEKSIPLHEEVLSVGKRSVETSTVRVETKVHETEESVEQDLDRTTVEVRRVPVGRVVDVPPETRREGDVLIVPVLEEELVVTKRLILKEEVHIIQRVDRRTEQVSATLRSEDVHVTRDGAPETTANNPRRDT